MESSFSSAVLLNSSKTLAFSCHSLRVSKDYLNQIFEKRFKLCRLRCVSNGDFHSSSEPISISSSPTSLWNSHAIVPFGDLLNRGRSFAASFASGGGDSGGASNEVIMLDVAGMMCEGCTSSVKRILESQVSKASADLATQTATIWLVPEAKAADNWQQQLGETLAKHLTNCGFKSNLQGQGNNS